MEAGAYTALSWQALVENLMHSDHCLSYVQISPAHLLPIVASPCFIKTNSNYQHTRKCRLESVHVSIESPPHHQLLLKLTNKPTRIRINDHLHHTIRSRHREEKAERNESHMEPKSQLLLSTALIPIPAIV